MVTHQGEAMPVMILNIPLAEQFRRRPAKPQRLVRFKHGISIQMKKAESRVKRHIGGC
jgi:hypothetical protein